MRRHDDKNAARQTLWSNKFIARIYILCTESLEFLESVLFASVTSWKNFAEGIMPVSLRRFVTGHVQGVMIVLLSLGSCSKAMGTTNSFFVHPDDVVYAEEGSSVTFEWDFITQRKGVLEFLFGEWGYPGYVKNKILSVHDDNKVSKRPGFEKNVDWSGDICKCANCTAKVTMNNLSREDFKTYGVDIMLSLDRIPLQHWLKLVKAEPATIINRTTSIEVQEGNATAIECKAKGLPPPHVKIVRRNRTLCNNTEHCVHKIEAAKSEDEGEYMCWVQQRNVSRQVRPMNQSAVSYSMNLTVHQGRKEKDRGTPASPPSTFPWVVTLVVSIVVLACLFAVCAFLLYKKVTKVYEFEEEGEDFEI